MLQTASEFVIGSNRLSSELRETFEAGQLARSLCKPIAGGVRKNGHFDGASELLFGPGISNLVSAYRRRQIEPSSSAAAAAAAALIELSGQFGCVWFGQLARKR